GRGALAPRRLGAWHLQRIRRARIAAAHDVMLEGKRLLITGVVTRRSIAWHVAEQAQLDGAEVVLTGFGRARRMTERAAAQLPTPADVLELDANSAEDVAHVAAELERRWGRLDGVLHVIAFAPPDALGGG